MIDNFIEVICKILKIRVPSISYDESLFPTETTMAMCSSDGKELVLRKKEIIDFDQLFAIAHELRHIWQIAYAKKHFFSDYKPQNECKSFVEYNMQKAEIDANAFAGVVMEEFFGITPLFNGMPNQIIRLIDICMDSDEIQSLFD